MQRKRQTTKTRILKAAWNLFYKKGYEGTSIDDIVAASKTSKGSFYHYFKGKEALLNSLSDLFDDKYEELAATIDPELSAYDKLIFINKELFAMIEETVSLDLLARLYASQLLTLDKRSLLDYDRFYFRWIKEIITDGVENGEFKETDNIDSLMDMYSMYERALIYDWALYRGKYSLTEYSMKLLPKFIQSYFIEGLNA